MATDLRLWCKDELPAVAGRIVKLQQVLLERAVEPPATPTCPATPTSNGPSPCCWRTTCWPTAGRWPATSTACWPRSPGSTCRPLGAGALAGSSLPLDPAATAADLGLRAPSSPTASTPSRDRDFVAEALFDLALVGIHLSRIGEEWVLWTSDELGFARLDDAYATGSSMLPQKKNPDIAELARGKAGRLIGDLTGLLVTLKGLPLAYNRDLQEDKEPLFDAVDQVSWRSAALTGMIVDRDVRARSRCRPPPTPRPPRPPIWPSGWSTGARPSGTPTRSSAPWCADRIRGEGDLADLVAAHPELGPEAAALVAPGVAVTRRTSPGGAGPGPVSVQLARFDAELQEERRRLGLDRLENGYSAPLSSATTPPGPSVPTER